jgi:hypothetical protein
MFQSLKFEIYFLQFYFAIYICQPFNYSNMEKFKVTFSYLTKFSHFQGHCKLDIRQH